MDNNYSLEKIFTLWLFICTIFEKMLLLVVMFYIMRFILMRTTPPYNPYLYHSIMYCKCRNLLLAIGMTVASPVEKENSSSSSVVTEE